MSRGLLTSAASPRSARFDSGAQEGQKSTVTIELPDVPTSERLTPEEVRLELACALYAHGRIGKVAATEIAGVDFSPSSAP